MAVETQRAVLGSAAPTKSAKSAESTAGAHDESGRFIVLGLRKKTGGLDTQWGSGNDAKSAKNQQRGLVKLEARRRKSAAYIA